MNIAIRKSCTKDIERHLLRFTEAKELEGFDSKTFHQVIYKPLDCSVDDARCL